MKYIEEILRTVKLNVSSFLKFLSPLEALSKETSLSLEIHEAVEADMPPQLSHTAFDAERITRQGFGMLAASACFNGPGLLATRTTLI